MTISLKDSRNIQYLILVNLIGSIIVSELASISNASTTRYYDFKVEYKSITKLCKSRKIVTVNGQYPGPTIYAQEGDRIIVKVSNGVGYNVTIHWHGVRQHFSCWFDGPAYITQCPIQSGKSFTYEFTLYQQKGTLFWHAHISWLRATVHGAIVIYPMTGVPYPFAFPYEEHVLIIGEYWNSDVEALERRTLASGGGPPPSQAYTINGHPGPLYNCSSTDVFVLNVKHGKTYLLRIINAGMNIENFFAIADHNLTVVAVDGSYTKPFRTSSLIITPGQTTDVLLTASHSIKKYYMGVGPYTPANIPFNNVPALAILNYEGSSSPFTTIAMLSLPRANDSMTLLKFTGKLRTLPTPDSIINVPQTIDRNLFFTVGLNQEACGKGQICKAPNHTRFSASMNNITFQRPSLAILQSYYYSSNRSYSPDFPDNPPHAFDYTGTTQLHAAQSSIGTRVSVLSFNSKVQLVLQDTSLTSVENHPIHLHGYSFYVVGFGLGNFNPSTAKFNLVDPPFRNTIGVPAGGWAAIRFTANNPGVWFMHCHLEIHTSWGLSMAFIVKNGDKHTEVLPGPPADLPKC
eukprot:c29483_g1_i1 orf=338-2059(-)